MEVANILQTKTYKLAEEEEVPIRQRGIAINANIYKFLVRCIQNSGGYLDDQRSSFSLNRTKFSLDHKLLPGLYQGFIRCNGKC